MALTSLLSPLFTSRPISDQGAFEDYIRAAIPTFVSSAYWPSTNTVQCYFSTPLSTSDQTLLQQKIDNYTNPTFVPVTSYYYVGSGMDVKTTNNTSYTTLFTFPCQGRLSPYLGVLTNFQVRGYLVPSLINDSGSAYFYYDVQIVDDSNTVLGSSRFTNSSEATYTITVANAPTMPCFLRLQVRKGAAGNYIQLTSFCSQYNF